MHRWQPSKSVAILRLHEQQSELSYLTSITLSLSLQTELMLHWIWAIALQKFTLHLEVRDMDQPV